MSGRASIPEHIRQKLEQVINLPTLPQVLARIIPMLGDPKVSARRVAEIISQDQALVSRILRIVNSAFYGFPRQIKTIDHALVLLGFNRLKAAIFTASVLEVFRSGTDSVGFDVRRFWEHVLGVAVISRSIAKYLKVPNIEEHFIFGLLHDVGKLVMEYYSKNLYRQVLDLVGEGKISIRDAEEKVLGYDHCAVGQLLFERWNLPTDIVEAVGWHHKIEEYNGKNLQGVAIVYAADILARVIGIGSGGDKYVPKINKNVFSLLHLDLAAIDLILEDAVNSLGAMKEFLEVLGVFD